MRNAMIFLATVAVNMAVAYWFGTQTAKHPIAVSIDSVIEFTNWDGSRVSIASDAPPVRLAHRDFDCSGYWVIEGRAAAGD